MTDPLAALTALWWRSVTDFTALLESLPEGAYDRPTDLPGWDVRAVAAHVAHLESLLGGGPRETAEVPDLPHVQNPQGRFCEIGVLNRRDRTGAELAAEIHERTAIRREALRADPPSDPSAPAPGLFGALGWTTLTLFRNRPLDVWMHEQDIRRAVDAPGNLDSPAAAHTADYLLESLGYVLAKGVGAGPGTCVVLEVAGHAPVAAVVGDDGRGRLLGEVPATPDVRLATDRESYLLRAGGRREVPAERFAVTGDADLAARVVAALPVTP